MKPVAAIVEPAAVDLLAERIIVAVADLRGIDSKIARWEGMLIDGRKEQQAKRRQIGEMLLKARGAWPERGPNAKGWGEFLRRVKVTEDSALRWMAEARGDFPQLAGKDDEDDGDRDTKPANDDEPDKPKANRDAWCTPEWLAALLPLVDLDPCSNPRSTIRAHRTYSLEAGQDGLLLPWDGLVYVNGPYSKLLPWAKKLAGEGGVTGAGFLVNADHSPGWWHVLKGRLRLRLDFDERLEFDPPPGVDPSKNDRPQTLLMDDPFWAACKQVELMKLGTLWRQI